MSWTATVSQVVKKDGAVLVTIDYSDGTNTVTETYRNYGVPAAQWVEKTVAVKIAQLEGMDATIIPTGAVSPVIETPPEQTAEGQWFGKFRRLERLLPLVTAGIIPADNAKWLALVNDVKAGLAAYFDNVR
jgi:hypothetical protein